MSENVVARLRKRIEYHALGLHPNYGPPSTLTHIECDTLAALLDIAEAMANCDPIEHLELANVCLFCEADDLRQYPLTHDPDCPKLLADKLCGKER